jgi:hypothetical protein
VNVTLLVGSAVGSDGTAGGPDSGGTGALSVEDDDVGSPLEGSVMARSHATAKLKKKRNTNSLLRRFIDVCRRKV